MNPRLVGAVAVLGGVTGAAAGWLAHGSVADRACQYTAKGYAPLEANVITLPEYPLENVSDEVVGEIQKCWAAHPYSGPQNSIILADARMKPEGGYYVFFEPRGTTDIQLAFLVDANHRVVGAYRLSMF